MGKSEIARVLVLDFQDAFMSIPIAQQERRFNATILPNGIRRQRAALNDAEPQAGTCLIWRVLGFGGRVNPLIYSRAASFAARTGQGLLGVPAHGARNSLQARGRLQLYVDDPAVCAAGKPQAVSDALDLLITYWLVLGIPLILGEGSAS